MLIRRLMGHDTTRQINGTNVWRCYAFSLCYLHRLLLTASLQPAVYEFFHSALSKVASNSRLFPNPEHFVNALFQAPPVLDEFGVPAVRLSWTAIARKSNGVTPRSALRAVSAMLEETSTVALDP